MCRFLLFLYILQANGFVVPEYALTLAWVLMVAKYTVFPFLKVLLERYKEGRTFHVHTR